jgi:uncharacterized protein with WD repeat
MSAPQTSAYSRSRSASTEQKDASSSSSTVRPGKDDQKEQAFQWKESQQQSRQQGVAQPREIQVQKVPVTTGQEPSNVRFNRERIKELQRTQMKHLHDTLKQIDLEVSESS